MSIIDILTLIGYMAIGVGGFVLFLGLVIFLNGLPGYKGRIFCWHKWERKIDLPDVLECSKCKRVYYPYI